MLCPKHHSWEPETGRYGLPSHLILAVFCSLYSCLKPPADFCRCTSIFMVLSFLFYSFSGIQHLPRQHGKWYPASARRLVPPDLCLVGLSAPGFESWGMSRRRDAWPGAPFLLPGLSQLHSTLCQLNSKTRDISDEQNVRPTKE